MKKTLGLALAACAGLLAGQAALAGSDVGSSYVAPQIQGVWLDDARQADDGIGFSMAFGRALSENWNFEFGLGGSSHDAAAGRKLKIQGFDFGLQRLFYRAAPVNPYFTVGFGRLDNRLAGQRESDYFLKYGVGVVADLARNADKGTNVQLRGEVLGRRADAGNGDLVDYLVGVGLQYSWGGKIAPKAPPDSDGDGVPDDMDKCPGTAPNTPVDANGCELDSDGDGVVDSRDKCPGTPAGTKVDDVGCPVDGDADGDGVKDSQDQCPGTPVGAKVNEVGCEVTEVVLRGVVFDTGKAIITPQSALILDEAATNAATLPGARIEVRGHTDDRGDDASNQRLSEARAKAVADYLVSKGIAAERLSSTGLGETEPVAPNDTAAGRAQNRRVTLKFTGR